jgi:putative addiction module component (TIGR02574 family)
MSRTLEQIEDEVLQLPEAARARLVESLLSSFQEQPGSDEAAIGRAWVEEAERRDDEMSSGKEEGLPAQEVFSKLRSARR